MTLAEKQTAAVLDLDMRELRYANPRHLSGDSSAEAAASYELSPDLAEPKRQRLR
jgi:hypothetical protein